MTARQRAHYFRDLWPAVLRFQGWDVLPPAAREEYRHSVTLQASHNRTSSTTSLNQNEITALFDLLKQMAGSLDGALQVVEREEDEAGANAEDEKRRLFFSIRKLCEGAAVGVAYAAAIARRMYGVSTMTPERLTVAQLTNLRNTVHNRLRKKITEHQAAPVPAENCPF